MENFRQKWKPNYSRFLSSSKVLTPMSMTEKNHHCT